MLYHSNTGKAGTQLLLDTFYSNEKAKQTLVKLITDGRLPHAVLIEGEDGCGKTKYAHLLAAGLLCTNTSTLEKPCGVCRNCKLVLTDTHPDVILAEGEDRIRSFHIDTLREIRADAHIRPNDGDIKVYLLRNAHNMTQQAQNAILKILEDPPKGVTFLLTCSNRSQLLSTILSRVTVIPIAPCEPEQVQKALEELEPSSDTEKLDWVVKHSHGSIGAGLTLLRDENRYEISKTALRIAELICIGNEFDLLCQFQPYTTGSKKREDFLRLIAGIKDYLMEILRVKNQATSQQDTDIPQIILNRITTKQAFCIVQISDKITAQVVQNISLPLAAAAFCASAKAQLEPGDSR